MRLKGVFIIVVVGLLLGAGCLGVYSRLFTPGVTAAGCIDEFCFIPRVVSYENHFGEPDNMDDNNFWISIKIRDTSVVEPEDIKDREHIAERETIADDFKSRMLTLFRFDSLVLRLDGEPVRMLLLPDTRRYTPRDIDYLSYHFEQAIIPLETSGLEAVFYYVYSGRDGSPARSDSLIYDMDRVETGESMLGLKKLIPPRDTTGSVEEE